MNTRISVIIPVLDESARIRDCLRRVGRVAGLHEVIVVDGGSTDGTPELARRHPEVRVVEAPRGRARQMNAGAAVATGDVLLFLHADVALPTDAARCIEECLDEHAVVAGAFRTWTIPDQGEAAPALLRLALHAADLRSRFTRLPYGDQAMFVRRAVFRDVGGFPDLPLMEDLALSERLRRRGRIRVVGASVSVSGRRFLAGPVYYTAIVNVLPWLFRAGVPASLLARLYGDPR